MTEDILLCLGFNSQGVTSRRTVPGGQRGQGMDDVLRHIDVPWPLEMTVRHSHRFTMSWRAKPPISREDSGEDS